MFREIFSMELRLVFRRVIVYIFFLLPAIYLTGCVLNENFQMPGTTAAVHRNAPFIVTTYTGIITLLGLVIATIFFNNAALRDYEYNFSDIFFSLPVEKNKYFWGRFCGALLASSFPFLGIYFGITLASFIGLQTGMLHHAQLGPIPLRSFLVNFFLIIVPNMFIAGTFTFILATKWKNTITSFMAPLIIVAAYILSGTLMIDIANQKLAALIDVLGIRAFTADTKYFTADQKNLVVFQSDSLLVLNRCIWIPVCCLLLFLSSRNFKISAPKRWLIKKMKPVLSKEVFLNRITNSSPPKYSKIIQASSFFKIDLRSVIKHPVFIVMILITTILYVVTLITKTQYLGLSSLPFTSYMIKNIGDIRELMINLMIIFFGGELVWRERQYSMADVLDATPYSIISSLISKVMVLITMSSVVVLILTFTAIIDQLVHGFTHIEIELYVKDFLYASLPTLLILSLLSISVQRLMNSKYLAYTFMIFLVFILPVIWLTLDIHTHLLTPGHVTAIVYSDMNGYGNGLLSALLFSGYWILLSILILLLTAIYTRRGMKGRRLKFFMVRLKSASWKELLFPIVITTVWLLLGGFLYQRTQLIDPMIKTTQQDLLKVAYEQSYRKFKAKPFPSLTAVSYFVDIYPESKEVRTRTLLKLVNKTNQPLHEMHFSIRKRWTTEITIPGAQLILADHRLGYRIYKLNKPLQPDSAIIVTIKAITEVKSIYNEEDNTNIAGNGTFITNYDFLPVMGYDTDNELTNSSKRKKMGLPQSKEMPHLNDAASTTEQKSSITKGKSGWVKLDVTVSTTGNQYALAPGSLIKSWKTKGRNYFHYKIDQPVQNFCAFLSASYTRVHWNWKGIVMEIYYDSKHPYNIPMMKRTMQKSIDYYTKNFGPYYLKELRIAEFPGYEQYAQAFPGIIPYSESMGFMIDLKGHQDFNVIQTVIAHEISHQWWGYQAAPGYVQGAKMLDESLAEYSSLMVMKQEVHDKAKMSNYLEYATDFYRHGQSHSATEPALYKVEENRYVYYGKATLLWYALQDYIGEKQVNAALKSYLEEYRFNAKHPTSLDLLRHIDEQVPDSLKEMVNDWFKRVTVYNLTLKDAHVNKLSNGSYKVTIAAAASKTITDSVGKSSILPFNGWVDVALYADESGSKMIINKRVKMDNKTRIEFIVHSKPVMVVADPYHILISTNKTDNRLVINSSTN